jgi:hypothetical protein
MYLALSLRHVWPRSCCVTASLAKSEYAEGIIYQSLTPQLYSSTMTRIYTFNMFRLQRPTSDITIKIKREILFDIM